MADRLILTAFFVRRRCVDGRAQWCCRSWHIHCRLGQLLKDPLPNSGFGPPGEARVHLLPRPKAVRKITPGKTSAITVEHRLDEQPVVARGYSDVALTSGQLVLDPVPLVVAESVSAHRSAPKS